MRRAIVIDGDYRFMSAVVGKHTASQLQVGDRVKCSKNLDIDAYGMIMEGATARVVFIDLKQELVQIEFDQPQDSLDQWRNCLLLAPFDTDDWISGLELVSVLPAKDIENCEAA